MDILILLLLQLVYVPLFTMRTIFLVRGQALLASAFGFLEAVINIAGLSIVLSGDKDIVTILVYAIGYGSGLLIGSAVEKKLAIGYTTFQVNVEDKNHEFIQKLRESGFGVTVYEGEGRDTKRYKMEILTKRNRQKELMKLIEINEPKAFVIAYEPRQFKGGFLVKTMKKSILNKGD